jgi:hypothetical protein
MTMNPAQNLTEVGCGACSAKVGISYEAWKALGAEGAAIYSAERLGLNENRQRKLARILAIEWGYLPNARAQTALTQATENTQPTE